MTLLDTLDRIVVAAEADAALELARTRVEKLFGWQKELDGINSVLAQVQATRAVLSDSGEQPTKWPKAEVAASALSAFAKSISDGSAGDAEYKAAAKALRAIQERARASLDESIGAVVEGLKEQKKRARGLESLGAVAGYERAAGLADDLDALAKENWFGADAAQLRTLFKRRQDAVRRLDELATADADVPASVRKFFRDARAGGATVAQLELKEVRAFLEKKEQLDAVRVIIK
jgi:hypothetical protein